ncbi:MAG: hypothetical protein H0X24_00055 [Ktedonobacterales bacterium]|nr:hypothetical protein [Ktedonobacterales bacterium]
MYFMRVMMLTTVSALALALGTLGPPVHAATRPSAPVTSCATYQATPHGVTRPATVTCVAHHRGGTTPNALGYPDCHNYDLVLYQDGDYKGGSLCLGPGDYNLTDFNICRGFFMCTSANDQMSSYRNNSGQWGYMTTDINSGGDTFWFAPNQAINYVGNYFNDQISFVHVD